MSLQKSILSVSKTYLNPGPQKYTVVTFDLFSLYHNYFGENSCKNLAIARYFETRRQKRISLL